MFATGSGSYTILDNVLNHYWTWAVRFLPMWMAPNLVTMLGTAVMIATTLVQLYFAPHLDEPCPTWVYLLSAAGLFFYQTMDALDGKQARRTGASSPLGQLFDHGCDALCTVFNLLSAAATCRAGAGLGSYIVLSSVCVTFYLAQWEEYHTGVMSCGNDFYGVTEGQLSLVAFHLLAAAFGADFWLLQTPLVPVAFPLWQALVGVLVASNVVLAFGNVSNVLTGPPIPSDELGNKHVSKALAMVQLVPIGILLVLGSLWIMGPDADNYARYPVLFLFPIGIGYVFFSTRMIVSHMCKIPFTPQLRVIIPFGLVILNAYGARVGLLDKSAVNPMVASALYVLFIFGVYLHFVSNVVKDICDYLNIFLFKISKFTPPETDKTK